MSSVKVAFGSSTAITVTLASLANGGARESAAIDNSSNLYLDAFITCKVKTGTTPTGDKAIYVYAAFSEDGTIYPDTVTGSDAGITLVSPTELVLLMVINCPSATTTYIKTASLLPAWGGPGLPRKWSLVFLNSTGTTLDSTGGNFVIQYTGVTQTVA